MADKVTPIVLSSGFASITPLNQNFSDIADELNNKVLYRNPPAGTPNQLEVDIDANSKRIINLPAPQANTDAARWQDVLAGVVTTETVLPTPTAQEGKFLGASGGVFVFQDTSNLDWLQNDAGATKRSLDSRLQDIVSIKDFGVTGDGVTDDTSAINAAIVSGRALYFPEGTYKVSGTIGGDSLTDVALYADSWNTKIISSVAGNVILFTNSTRIIIKGLFVKGIKTLVNAAACINLEGCTEFLISDNYVTDASRMGIRTLNSNLGAISNNIATSSFQDGIMVRNTSEHVSITGNICFDNGEVTFNPPLGEGIHLFSTRDVAITGNICYNNSNNGISLEGAERSTVTTNTCRSNVQSGISVGSEAVIRGDKSIISNNICVDNTVDGIIIADVSDLIVANNQCHNNNQWGIRQGILTAPDIQERINICGNNCSENAFGAINHAFVNADSRIEGNILRGPLGWGVLLSNNTSTNTYIAHNNIRDFATVLISDLGTDTVIKDNQGYITEARGTDTIPSGSTSVVITHGLSRTPTREDIVITPGNNTTADIRSLWVATFTSTTFQVNVGIDPGTSGFSFGWRVA